MKGVIKMSIVHCTLRCPWSTHNSESIPLLEWKHGTLKPMNDPHPPPQHAWYPERKPKKVFIPKYNRNMNSYHHKETNQEIEFKFWTRLFAFHFMLITLWRAWSFPLSFQLWINRVDWASKEGNLEFKTWGELSGRICSPLVHHSSVISLS